MYRRCPSRMTRIRSNFLDASILDALAVLVVFPVVLGLDFLFFIAILPHIGRHLVNTTSHVYCLMVRLQVSFRGFRNT